MAQARNAKGRFAKKAKTLKRNARGRFSTRKNRSNSRKNNRK